MDTTIPYEIVTHLAAIDARLDALEAAAGGGATASSDEEESPPTRTARGRS